MYDNDNDDSCDDRDDDDDDDDTTACGLLSRCQSTGTDGSGSGRVPIVYTCEGTTVEGEGFYDNDDDDDDEDDDDDDDDDSYNDGGDGTDSSNIDRNGNRCQ